MGRLKVKETQCRYPSHSALIYTPLMTDARTARVFRKLSFALVPTTDSTKLQGQSVYVRVCMPAVVCGGQRSVFFFIARHLQF